MKGRGRGILIRLMCLLAGLAVIGLPLKAAHAGGGGIVRYVKPGGAKSGQCLTWGTACELRYALSSVAIAGDNIWAKKGIYKPTGTTNRAISFQLKNGVQIYGGFAGTETAFSQRNFVTNVSVLSGDIGVVGNASDNSYHVFYNSAVDSTAVLDGFQIVGGSARAAGYLSYLTGGGMVNSTASPTLKHLRFIGNVASNNGGAMYNITGSHPLLLDVSFEGNSATNYAGGAIYNNASSPLVVNVTFSGNAAGTSGGALYNANASSPVFSNVTFSGNVSGQYGGAIYNVGNGTNPSLTNVTFNANSATTAGGAIYNDTSASTLIYNGIFWGDGPDELVNATWGTASIHNTIMAGGCPLAGATCDLVSAANPMLGPLQNNGGFTKTMALGVGSAAVDRGSGSTYTSKDQRGVVRPQGFGIDIGAYEVRATSSISQAVNDGWLLESTETSGAGGTAGAGSASLIAGDNSADKQYRSILSFNTAGVPDGATIILGKLSLTWRTTTGTDPFITHGGLIMDLAKPYFGTGIALQASDFQSPATTPSAGTVKLLSGTVFQGTLNNAGRAGVNKAGTTQIRLRFTLDDNDDGSPDSISFYSGNALAPSDRPILMLYYNP